MSGIRFNHVFVALMLLSGLTAFILPPQKTSGLQGAFQGIFYPVSAPVRWFAGRLNAHLSRQVVTDMGQVGQTPRTLSAVLEENQLLHDELATLTAQLDQLKALNADRSQMGQVRLLCTPYTVIGVDATSHRDALNILGSTVQNVQVGMRVLYSGGIVGRIERSGVTGAQVLLITDPNVRLEGQFGRFSRQPDGRIGWIPIATPTPLVRGAGRGLMVITNLTLKDVMAAGISTNDWVSLHDREWPSNLDGQIVGRIVAAPTPWHESPLYAQIWLQPVSNLMELSTVMVMNK